jgi:drug/metabolite transporter (DMT)-like permease
MQSIGIVLGLTVAFLQSCAYFFSRRYVIRRGGAVMDLLILSHILMGLASLALLPLAAPRQWPPLRSYFWPLMGTAGFYVIGQLALLTLMRRMEASRIAPLLSLKILILAIATTLLPDQSPLSAGQWAAACLCLTGALLLYFAGPAFTLSSAVWLLTACLGYSFSDLSIKALVKSLDPIPTLHASVLAACLSYVACGIAAIPFLPLLKRNGKWRDWPAALPYASAWFLAMIALFGCFGIVGTVYGNILQSTRGIMSVVIGAALAHLGWIHIEERTSRIVLLRRLAAAVLMTLAIWLYQR